jgi:4-hydroxy-tetrahydrodipicolinate synthase
VLGVVPFVLQDFPLVTNVIMSPLGILKIIEDCPTCMMLKHEDSPGLEKISTMRAASDGGARRISVMCGNGGLYLLEEMLRGADGAMTGFAYPEMMSQVIEALLNKEGRVRNIFNAYMPMIRY